jgi:hypothetical protein
MDQQKLLETRKKLASDFAFYCKHCVFIRTKDGTLAPLVLNTAQKMALEQILAQWQETGKVRAIISKGRQQGMSTMIQAFAYWVTTHRKHFKSLVIAHEAEATKSLFTMTKRIHDNMPEIMKMTTKYSNRTELVFKDLDSGYRCATAGNEDAGRGETLQFIHASEMAFWKPSHAEELWNGLYQAVPPTSRDTFVFIESTSNGMGNLYHRMWNAAENHDGEFVSIFIPWYVQEEYRLPVPKDFKPTEDESALCNDFGLDFGQLQFRRMRIAATGPERFMQEYPFTAKESFLASGRPVFDPLYLQRYFDKVAEPIARKSLEGKEWVNHSRGELLMYSPVDDDENYTIGVDVGIGLRDHDYTVCQVLDSAKNLVATWRGYLYPDIMANVVAALGYFYNEALVVVENNNHGILTANRLAKDLVYPNMYTEMIVDKTTDQETIRLGFNTNAKSKPNAVNALRALIRDGDVRMPDRNTLNEMQSFIVTESGKYEAEPGMHDDAVMALAIAVYCHQPSWTPVEVTDDYYIRAI